MKHTSFFLLLILSIGTTKAQLKVDAYGNAGFGANASSTSKVFIRSTEYDGLNVSSTADEYCSGTCISAYASSNSSPSSLYGVRAFVQGATYVNVGVLGQIGLKGAAILGTVQGYSFALSQPYAGYFYGNVQTAGTLTSTGGISGTFLTSAPSSPTRQAPSQTLDLTNGVSSLFSGLSAQAFYQDQTRLLSSKENRNAANDSSLYITENELPLSPMEEQVLTKQHFGLDADQLEEVFPDLVYENEDGTKSINYVEMVPILVQAINELKEEINELKGTETAKKAKKATGLSEKAESVQVMFLGQNKPNPFSTTTEVEVTVPESVQHAFVYVYDLNGKKVQQVDITARGKQTVSINAATLEEGMYLYSLIADGQVVQTRRMIIEK